MILKSVTCNSFPWNKAGDFFRLLAVPSELVEPPALVAQASRREIGERARYTMLCPNMDKNKIDAAHTENCASYVTFK